MSSAIEVPDWYRTVALVGVDLTGTPVVVLLDSTGAIMAVMKGEYAGTLKNIAVDASGRIVSVIRDPTSDNYIAIDANGYIAAVLKATYSGALKDVACDAEGRIIMIPTDPADVWGNAISMGNAELAAVLSPAKRFDRRGNVIWLDAFEEGLGKWTQEVSGTGAAVELATETAATGAFSLKLTGGSDVSRFAGILKTTSILPVGNYGSQVAYNVSLDLQYLDHYLRLYTGTKVFTAGIRYDWVNSLLQYLNSAAVWTTLVTGVKVPLILGAFDLQKLVVDFNSGYYVRLLYNDQEYDLSTYSFYQPATAYGPYLESEFLVTSQSGLNGLCYIDSVVLTINEPA